MKVTRDGQEDGAVALDDIAALVVHGHGATFSANLMSRLAERGCPVVLCDHRHIPIAVVYPIDGHHQQGLRMAAQAAASKPLQKRLWRDLVKAKAMAQADALDIVGMNGSPLRDLAKRVRSGDPENIEAQVARRYWSQMMGKGFRRDRDASGTNALLNYAYMILRAATARAIVASGLHPSLSIHHISRGTALRLADDLMEPFRPYADLRVRTLTVSGQTELTADAKRSLAAILALDLHGPYGAAPLQTGIDRLATSLGQVYCKERQHLELPGAALALDALSR